MQAILLQENGSHLLQESGFEILLEVYVDTGWSPIAKQIDVNSWSPIEKKILT